MKSKVFVSCGQATEAERRTAEGIRRLLAERGFKPYIAIQVKTILDINGGIIGELKDSDYYLFVNFRRDLLPGGSRNFRGSLFSNQEFAIAYALRFENILIVNQSGIKLEGMLAYIGHNTQSFEDHDDCLDTVARNLDEVHWNSGYSRRLRAENLVFSSRPIPYSNHAGSILNGYFLYLDIHNARPDIAAIEATARLVEYGRSGQPLQPSHIRSPLKATGRPGFAHTIFPRSYEAFDLLCVGSLYAQWSRVARVGTSGTPITDPPTSLGGGVFLNSALDAPWTPLGITPGVWSLRYEFVAIGFPLLSVMIELTYTDGQVPAARLVAQEIEPSPE